MGSTRTRLVSVMIAALLAVVTAGCSAASRTEGAASLPANAASATARGGGGVATGDKANTGDKPASVQVLDQPPEQAGRMVVSTATMTVNVDDVVAAKEKSKAKIEGLGGTLFNEQTSLSAKSSSTLTYKVEPQRFSEALRELSGLGKLASQEVKTDDVTQQAVDLDARIRAAEASTQRVGELVGRSNNVTELANLENEVQRRQAELESLRGQKRTLEARADLATIVLTLATGDAPPAPPAEAKPLPGFLDGLSGGWNALANVMTVAGAVLGALLPFAWIGLIAFGIVWVTKRRGRLTRPADA